MASQFVRIGSGAANQITPSLAVSRMEGPAPLGVFFDATDTARAGYSTVECIRFLGYYYDFDDEGAGDFIQTGKTKAVQVGGPMAYHVFETPGTYIVKLGIFDAASGSYRQVDQEIVVTDPDSTFSGTDTVCISLNTNHDEAPSGAQLISNATNFPTREHGKRYLLHRGHDFSSFNSGSLDIRAGSGGANNEGLTESIIGAYGTGADPILGQINFDGSGVGGWPTNVVIQDVQCRQVFQVVEKMSEHILMLRVMCDIGGGNFDVDLWRYSGIVECSINPNYSSPGVSAMCLSGRLWESAIVDTFMHRAVEHNVRLFQYYKFLAMHNRTTGRCLSDVATDQPRHCYKMHSAGTGSATGGGDPISGDASDRRSAWGQISDCYLGSDNTNINWLGGIGPQNADETEGCELTLFENNECEHREGGEWNEDWHAGGRDTVARGNININSGGAAVVGPGEAPHMPPEWNTGYYLDDEPPETQAPV